MSRQTHLKQSVLPEKRVNTESLIIMGDHTILELSMKRLFCFVKSGTGKGLPPRARTAEGRAPALGADTEAVLRDLGIP